MEALHYALMKTHTMLQRKISEQAAELGLTSGQPKVLDCLFHIGECEQKSIASYCEIEQTTVGSILNRMEQAGLIVRQHHEGNRRSLFVSLSPKGREITEKLQEIFRREEAELTVGLSTEEIEAFRITLEKMETSLKRQQEEQKK